MAGKADRKPVKERVKLEPVTEKVPFRRLSMLKWEPDFEDVADALTASWPPSGANEDRVGHPKQHLHDPAPGQRLDGNLA